MSESKSGLEATLLALDLRIANNLGKPHVDNSRLWAGSPMHFYCAICNGETVLSESHLSPEPRYCGDCTSLITSGDIRSWKGYPQHKEGIIDYVLGLPDRDVVRRYLA
jgi:hypothetical protein